MVLKSQQRKRNGVNMENYDSLTDLQKTVVNVLIACGSRVEIANPDELYKHKLNCYWIEQCDDYDYYRNFLDNSVIMDKDIKIVMVLKKNSVAA